MPFDNRHQKVCVLNTSHSGPTVQLLQNNTKPLPA